MDLRDFYRLVAEQEAAIQEPFVLIVSRKTSTGGREGVISEVSRSAAARMIVQEIARLATAAEAAAHRDAFRQAERDKRLESIQESLRMAAFAKGELKALRQELKKAGKRG